MIVQVDIPLVTTSGQPAQTDAKGNFTSVTMIHPANWSVVRLVAQTTGGASWLLLSDNGLPLDFATSAFASMGLVLVAPGQRLTTQILAALPAVSVLGHFVGVMSPVLEEVLPFYQAAPNPVGSTISGATSDLGRVSDVNGVGTTKTLTLPTGTIALQILPGSSVAGSAPLGLTIRGTVSRDTYFFIPSTGAGGLATNPYYVIAPQSGFEPQMDVTVTAHAAQTDFVEIIALTTPVAQATVITGIGTSGITSGGQDISSNAAGSIPVVPAKFYAPAPWQSPLSVINVAVTLNQVGAGDTAVIIPAAFGQTVRLWGVTLSIDTAVATGAVQLETTAPVSIHQFGVSAVNPNPFPGNGVPLAVGVGVQLRNLMGANPAAMRGSMVYSQQ